MAHAWLGRSELGDGGLMPPIFSSLKSVHFLAKEGMRGFCTHLRTSLHREQEHNISQTGVSGASRHIIHCTTRQKLGRRSLRMRQNCAKGSLAHDGMMKRYIFV